MQRTKAFTLIELLIVVAIIAILAAIAVPNFLEAQTRAKVSRVKADMRTLVTGLEAYAVDYNNYPPDVVLPILVRASDGNNGTAEGFASPPLSTPVAYLTIAQLPDPFVQTGNAGVIINNQAYKTLFYQNVKFSVLAAQSAATATAYRGSYQTLSVGQINTNKYNQGWSIITPTGEQRYGSYKLGSLGPDRFYQGGANIYDPTNGTLSLGDIYRTSKSTTGGYSQ